MLILSEMIKNNELKVMLISGIKPLYIFSIFLTCGVFSSLISFSVKNFISPHLIKKINLQISKTSISFSSSNYFFYSEEIIGNLFMNVEFTEYLSDGEIMTVKAKMAENYKENDWIFKEGCLWKFDREKNLIKEEKFKIKNLKIPLTSEILLISNIDVEKFSFSQLFKIIKKMESLKLKPVSLITYLNEKISYPLLNFFIIFVIYPVFKKGEKISTLYVFSFSFLFSLFAYGIYIFFFSLSKNGKFPSILGPWILHTGIIIYFLLIDRKFE
jgi:lipopolysaccharide export LptBFGC system permease protein LptF